jgi:hypothetical protein
MDADVRQHDKALIPVTLFIDLNAAL